MSRRTKIVCTLGPSVDSKAKLRSLIAAGMNVARINCSHGDWETRRKWIKWINELQPKVNPVGILVDLQGPKVRIGKVEGGSLNVQEGAPVTVVTKGTGQVAMPDAKAWATFKAGDEVLVGDGGLAFVVVERRAGVLLWRAQNAGTLKTGQGVTIVGRSFDIAPITDKDKKDIKEALDANVDFIALSYVRSAEDVESLRKLLDRRDKAVKTVAKIETREAMSCIEDVVSAADVVMVARGDLGLQVALEDVPVAQKRIISVCNSAATPVITATQMLESMVANPRPTRAEASDVANAILDGTDAVMLSGETAAGEYPVEAVTTMAKIAARSESLLASRAVSSKRARRSSGDAETDSVALAAVGVAATLRTHAILTSSTSGMTPRLVSRYRPTAQILCVCWNQRTQRQLSVVWGVEAAYAKLPKGTDAAVDATIDTYSRLGRVKAKERVVVTAGVPAGVPGNTNMILVRNV